MTLLTQRAVVLAKIESVFDTDPLPVEATDAILVGQPNYAPDITQLERDVVRQTLSPLATRAGRKIAQMTFTHEVRGSGDDTFAAAPKIGALLRACGMAQTQRLDDAASTIGDAVPNAANTGTIAFADTTVYAGLNPRVATITCTTGGASGIAVVDITAPAIGADAAVSQIGVTVTDASPLTLANGAQVTPTVGTPLVAGDIWTIPLSPPGYEYTPVSTAFSSVTLYMFLDGLLHKMTGCRGTFSADCPGGQFGSFTFTFQGSYVAAEDLALPTAPDYENTLPPQVELAALNISGNEAFCAARWAIDIANNVVPRDCVNNNDAFAGVIITGRSPTASFDPEAELVAVHDFWGNLANGTSLSFGAKVGTVKGNIVQFTCPNVQYTQLAYGDRESIRTFDVTMNLATSDVDVGDNELLIAFR